MGVQEKLNWLGFIFFFAGLCLTLKEHDPTTYVNARPLFAWLIAVPRFSTQPKTLRLLNLSKVFLTGLHALRDLFTTLGP